jgi:uncharacterized RDD family membrane protein YckC
MQRFDEIVLEPMPLMHEAPIIMTRRSTDDAPRFHRLLALLTDISLFVALALALSPLLPPARDILAIAGLTGFVIVISYYYFVGTWLLWGKTIGGEIFDVKVIGRPKSSMSVRSATLRWVGIYASMLTGGIGFLFALLPSRLSLADRLSHTRSITAT